ncbi:hypothetical protein Vadar_007451 [Vaccinium darrowii]|uniref:Uncharacterized protein n=1 Tax=Vaccinium darrowii TaxID=229202 RepID=A0ACB7ZA68_9ERIC|nr:hypothetical protein Vadar_007451 [Vaccinium darrowii]
MSISDTNIFKINARKAVLFGSLLPSRISKPGFPEDAKKANRELRNFKALKKTTQNQSAFGKDETWFQHSNRAKLESHFLEQRLFAGNRCVYYGLGAHPDSGQLVIYRRGESYWTSGPLKVNGPYNLSFVSNDDENYLTFCGIVDGRLWELRPNSRIEEGANSKIFGPSGFCYGCESGDGCVTSVLPQCRSSNDKFEEKRASFFPSIATSEYDENSSLSIKDCMEMC